MLPKNRVELGSQIAAVGPHKNAGHLLRSDAADAWNVPRTECTRQHGCDKGVGIGHRLYEHVNATFLTIPGRRRYAGRRHNVYLRLQETFPHFREYTSCARGRHKRHKVPHPCKLTFDLLTLKVVSESRGLPLCQF